MKMRKKNVRGFLAISLIGDMEVFDAEQFEEATTALIKKGQKNIVIDFEGLNYISSSGLRALINIRALIEKEGGRLVLAALKDKVLEVFRISKLLSIFEVVQGIDTLPD